MQELKSLQEWKTEIGIPAVNRLQYLENEIKERTNSEKSAETKVYSPSKYDEENLNLYQTTNFVQKRLQTTIDELKCDILQLQAVNQELVIKLGREMRNNKWFFKSCSSKDGNIVLLNHSSGSQEQTFELGIGGRMLPVVKNDSIKIASQRKTHLASMFSNESNDYQIISDFPMIESKIPASTFSHKSKIPSMESKFIFL